MHYFTYPFLLMSLMFPLGAHAQTTLEAEIRAAIAESAREQGLTSTEIDALVQALSEEAADQGISATDVAAAQVALVSQQDVEGEPVSAEVATSPMLLGPTALSLLLVTLAVFVLWLWRKMRHGGALGPVETA